MDQLYSATYSGVAVYEYINHTGSVMRRKSDGWVNATHILKAANFPKAKRTRILEKDVQVGEHEKVQGGYGKYQGTWVPLPRAREIAKQFGVDDILSPLFNLESTQGANSPPPAPKHHHASKNNSILAADRRPSQRKVTARRTASTPVITSADIQPQTVGGGIQKKRGRPRRLNAPIINPNKGVFIGRRAVSSLEKHDKEQDGLTSSPPGTSIMDTNTTGFESEEELDIDDGISSDIDETTNLNLVGTSSSPSEFMSDTDLANALRSPNKKINQSARESLEKAINSHTGNIRNINREDKWFDLNAEYTARLLEYFMQPDEGVHSSQLPEFLLHPPKGFNVDQIIDEEGHTSFHWACAMGNPLAAEALINLGASYRCVNNAGETALMRAVSFTNSFAKRTFPRMVEILTDVLLNVDSSHRTVLHHIADAASSKARVPSANYYMDTLLAKLFETQASGRALEFLNLQDNNGDTALHLCAKNANRKCIKLLLENKAKTNIRNNEGLLASDILLDNENVTPKIQQRYESHLKNQRLSQSVAQPHISEAAIEATHKVANFLVDSLNELSNAYDSELQRKESDAQEVQELLTDMNEEIKLSELRTNEFLGEKLDTKRLEERVSLIMDQVKRHETLAKNKEIKLQKLLERSQAKEISKLVQKQETQIKNPSNNVEMQLKYSIELTKLQIQRKHLISDIIKLYSDVDGSSSKMQKYKRLIAACSDVVYDEVSSKIDELLQEIEKDVV